VDREFPDCDSLRIENGEPILTKGEKKIVSPHIAKLEQFIEERLEPINILDVLADCEHWFNWTRHLGPVSGHDAKLDNPKPRYVAAVFGYGCGLGPTQTARSLKLMDRRQIAWINQRHVTEDALNKIITEVINKYNKFTLPKVWGSGKSASADGTKWDLYEQNLLSEYHIRYGGYGGLGYYHVSDTYIALFSHFIPCGVWEAVYILDGLLKNESDIQPDTLHADTQGQSTPVFGLAHLLGINLMPRIRNWKDLTLFRPSKDSQYQHIDGLFTDTIDWKIIEDHFTDMLRIVLSIKAGRVSASSILRRLGTYSRKNKLYAAFAELGRVVRTIFLLKYISDTELRSTINAATNKSEQFNDFIKWVRFGGDGRIQENDRDEQRKLIKYNHLVANCLIFHNVCSLTRLLSQLANEGHEFDEETIAQISPYIRKHVNRFGDYVLNMERGQPLPTYDFAVTNKKFANAV
jgi:TnpA family transposase